MSHLFTVFLLFLVGLYNICAYDLTQADRDRILQVHNDIRTKYGVPALAWDSTVAQSAKSYSDQCIWGHDANNANYGENIGYKGFSSPTTFPYTDVAATAIDWNGEETGWTCANNDCPSGGCGHFTQDVWKNTKSIGCGLTPCVFQGFKSQYLVCRYNPPGNYGGQHPLNAPLATPLCPGSPPPPTTTTGTTPPPPTTTTGTTPPPPTTTTGTTPPPPTTTTGTTPPPPTTTGSTGSYTACQVNCNGVKSTCTAAPQIISGKLYCSCLTETMMWGVSNPGSTACPYGASPPPVVPYNKCKVNCAGTNTFCHGPPTKFTGYTGLYCDCGAASGYSYSVSNLNTPDCQYVASAVSDATSSESSSMTTGQWIGVCVGIVVVALVVIVIVVVVINKRKTADLI